MDKEKLKIENWAMEPVPYNKIIELYKEQEQEDVKNKLVEVLNNYFEIDKQQKIIKEQLFGILNNYLKNDNNIFALDRYNFKKLTEYFLKNINN